jgi:glycosyltransferase involved in cell wall biosynthesis
MDGLLPTPAPHLRADPPEPRHGRDLATLRVALVHDWLTGLRGGEKCLESLCQIFPQATIHTLLHRPGSVGPTIERQPIRTTPLQRLPGIARHYRKLLPLMPAAARCWQVGDVDLVVSLSHCVAKAVRTPPGVPHVCYCFTPMRYAWDTRDAYFASWRGRPLRRAVASLLLDRLRAWDRATAPRVTHFIAISETIRDRIARSYGRDSHVIQPPVDADFYTPPADPQHPRNDTLLCVSALVAYKRIDQAVAACTALGRRLVIIGEGPERKSLQAIAGPTVQFLGWQPDDVIRDHYRRSRALLYPAEEDFGIVPIEALACGLPVIALGRGGVAETVDPRVGALYDHPSADALATAITRWEADGRPFDPSLARARAEALSVAAYQARIRAYLAHVLATDTPTDTPARPHLSPAPTRTRRDPAPNRT